MPVIDKCNPSIHNSDKCKHKVLFKDLGVVSKLQASCKSPLVECDYYLIIRSYFHGVVSGFKTPEVVIPVAMRIPEFKNEINVCKPARWLPLIMPTHVFSFLDVPLISTTTDSENFGSFSFVNK
jgi:hypothetical protein